MNALKTILYFSIFKYPITKEEVFKFSKIKSKSQLDDELEQLLDNGIIYKFDEIYNIKNNYAWVERRLKGNIEAKKKMKKARKMANIMKYFPFVQSIMISGTLSKNYMDATTDIDFFVITKPGNIVISKFLMGTFRRLFARNSFCVNFLLDWDNLYIKKQNIYTAIEIATLIPVVNYDLYEKFINTNNYWVLQYLPNIHFHEQKTDVIKKSILKKSAESLLQTKPFLKLGDWMRTKYLKKLGSGRAEQIQSLHSNELEINKGIFKGHHFSYESRILALFELYQKDIKANGNLEVNTSFYD